MKKKDLIKALEEFDDDDFVVISVHDTVAYEDLYEFFVDPIHMGIDKEGNDRGHEIHLNLIPHHKDLFEHYDELPSNVQEIINSFSDEGNLYAECERLLQELRPLGYEFDYDLSGEPFNLRKVN
jgi:hypothetical protein